MCAICTRVVLKSVEESFRCSRKCTHLYGYGACVVLKSIDCRRIFIQILCKDMHVCNVSMCSIEEIDCRGMFISVAHSCVVLKSIDCRGVFISDALRIYTLMCHM